MTTATKRFGDQAQSATGPPDVLSV